MPASLYISAADCWPAASMWVLNAYMNTFSEIRTKRNIFISAIRSKLKVQEAGRVIHHEYRYGCRQGKQHEFHLREIQIIHFQAVFGPKYDRQGQSFQRNQPHHDGGMEYGSDYTVAARHCAIPYEHVSQGIGAERHPRKGNA